MQSTFSAVENYSDFDKRTDEACDWPHADKTEFRDLCDNKTRSLAFLQQQTSSKHFTNSTYKRVLLHHESFIAQVNNFR